MAQYHKALVDAQAVTLETRAAAQARLDEATFTQFLPDTNSESDKFEFNTDQAGGIPAAVYRAYDAEAPFGSDTQTFAFSGTIPPISQKMALKEKDIRANAGRARDEVLHNARLNGIAIAQRSLLARGEALETGKFVLAGENKLHFTVDFQRPANHTVAAAASWTLAGTDVIADLLAWQAVYNETNKTNAGAVLLSTRILNALTTNTSIISEARPGVTASRVSPAEVMRVLESYGFSNVVVNDDQAIMPDGTVKRVINDDKVLLLPGGGSSVAGSALGRTQWGVPTEAFNPEYGIGEGSRAGLFGANYFGHDPEGFYILGAAVVLPVLTNAKATFVADVIA